jgi:P-type conjugative transfer protein TrbJ
MTLLLVLLPCHAIEASGILTFDLSALTQQLIHYKTMVDTYTESLTHTANQVRQIQNQVAQLQGLATQVSQGATNLLNFRYSSLQDILTLSAQLDSKLAYAQSIGHQLNASVAQANSIYPSITSRLSAPQLRAFEAQWVQAQRSQAQAAIQMQSVQQAHAQAAASLTQLTAQAAQTQGALQVGQAQAQIQANQARTLLGIESQLAVQGRTQALEAMRQAALQDATMQMHQQSFQELPLATPAQGRWLSVR